MKPSTYERIPHREDHITIKTFENYNSASLHWHEIIEILYYHDDHTYVDCNLEEIHIKNGDIIFVNMNELHKATKRGFPSTYHCIHLRTDFFSNLIGGKYVVFKNLIRDKRCADLLDKVIKCYESDDFNKEIYMKKHMYEFFEIICKDHVQEVFDRTQYMKNFKVYDKFNDIVIYINDHYDEEITVGMIAEKFFVSESYLSSFFKEKSGKSMMKYVNEVRIERAKTYLLRTNMSIGEIADSVGFGDINYFSRKFRLLVGMTPSEYRKRKNSL